MRTRRLSSYLTASFKAFAALNLGTLIAGTFTDSPVRGFLATLAALCLVEKIPNPAIETSTSVKPFLLMNDLFILLGSEIDNFFSISCEV